MGKKKEHAPTPKEFLVDPEECKLRILYDFAYYLENLPGKSGCDGALNLLRMFLAQRDTEYDNI